MRKSIFTRAFWQAATERAFRGAIAAEAGAYIAGNLVFDTTHIGVTLGNVLAIAVGGAVSAFGLSVAGNAVSKNGPSFTRAEVVPESTIPTGTRPAR
jgi:hypothetical protein